MCYNLGNINLCNFLGKNRAYGNPCNNINNSDLPYVNLGNNLRKNPGYGNLGYNLGNSLGFMNIGNNLGNKVGTGILVRIFGA